MKSVRGSKHISYLACLIVLSAFGCRHASTALPENNTATVTSTQGPETPSARFVDVAESAGISYRWTITAKRPLNILQTIGNGCAFLDYNQDGNLDILLIGPKFALYRGDGQGHFQDVTHDVGLDAYSGQYLGCAVGDYDNDGYPDIYVSGYGVGLLLHNDKGVKFSDVTAGSGLKPQAWGSSCTFADVDGDGKLDLYVADYLAFGPNTVPQLCSEHGHDTACGPMNYLALRGVMYHNLGNGKFEDVTAKWGADSVTGKSLGAAFVPGYYAGTRSLMLAIANDEEPGDLLTYNRTIRKFTNTGSQSGVAYGSSGKPQGGMGLDWGDYSNEGRPALVVTTFESQPKPIYKSSGAIYQDQSESLNSVDPLIRCVSFGVKWFDYDNDGFLDLIVANGHISDNIADINPSRTYRQPTVLLHNSGGIKFSDVSHEAGISKPIVGRGLAVGDFDNDGRVDVLVVDSEGAPMLLHNETPRVGHWLELKLAGAGRSNRDAIGAVVTVHAGKLVLTRHCHTDGSYLSASDPRVHFGLGNARSADIAIRWPDGSSVSFKNIAADRIYNIIEGAAAPITLNR